MSISGSGSGSGDLWISVRVRIGVSVDEYSGISISIGGVVWGTLAVLVVLE